MKIIALKGRHDCGKSETLGIHLRELLTGRPVDQSEWWKVKDKRESIAYEEKMIDLCPPGDTEDIVLANIAFFEAHPCEVAFTATRTRGKGCNALEKFAKKAGAKLVWIWKDYNDDLDKVGQTEANKTLAQELFEMI